MKTINHRYRVDSGVAVSILVGLYIFEMPETPSTDKIEVTLRISELIRDQADAVAIANGLKPAEQYRQFFLSGLRAEQQKLKNLGLIGGEARSRDTAAALLKSLADGTEPDPGDLAAEAKRLGMAPHVLINKLKKKGGNGAESRATH
ncbi:MAG: hypothetical protein ACR2FS_15175 [Phormidesmis sp.]